MKDQIEEKVESQNNTKNKNKKEIIFWVTVLTFLGSIITFLWKYDIDRRAEKHANEIINLKTKISSIERNIGENDYFDVKKMFLTKDNRNTPTPSSSYIPNGNFYIDTTDTDWAYKKVSPTSFLRKGLNINSMEFQLGREYSFTLDSIFKNPDFKNYRRKYKFHQFIHKDSIKINIGGKKQVFNSKINVLVLKKDVANTVFNIINKNINKEKEILKSLDIDSSMVNQVIRTAEKQFDRNSSGLIFNLILNGMIYQSLSSGNTLELESVQKKSEVFYTKYLKEYDVSSNKLFETGEIFFADRNNHIYIVLIKVVDKQPLIRTDLSADINKWLFSLKFL